MQITTGKYHTFFISNSSVYSCGSGLCGVLGHGPETTQCVAFTRLDFPPLARVAHVSAFYNHAAFVMQSGEVCNCLSIIQSGLIKSLAICLVPVKYNLEHKHAFCGEAYNDAASLRMLESI